MTSTDPTTEERLNALEARNQAVIDASDRVWMIMHWRRLKEAQEMKGEMLRRRERSKPEESGE